MFKSHKKDLDHIADRELLLSLDGELTRRRAAEVCAHLKSCRKCQARAAAVRTADARFAEARRHLLDSQFTAAAISRARLHLRLSEPSRGFGIGSWERSLLLPASIRPLVLGAALVALLIGVFWTRHPGSPFEHRSRASLNRITVPNSRLTPGAARTVTIGEVCSLAHEQVVVDVPSSVRAAVFHEYGIADPQPGEYEIDYLIAPGLGGTQDIRNLWPEPYRARTWNAHVKDTLEERLHQMVCSRKLALGTAQRDIATNWIAAYRKYFHTDRPVVPGSGMSPAPYVASARCCTWPHED